MPEKGYPTKAELRNLKRFHGTIPAFFDYVEYLWVNGHIKREVRKDHWGRDEHVLTFVTGGWSGCEETIGVVNRTLAGIFTHSKWERGGLFEYTVSQVQWDMKAGFWGYLKYATEEETK